MAPTATGLSAPPAVGSRVPVIIGPANDAAEREAERIAGTVASPMPVPSPVSSIGESRRSEGTQAGPAAPPVVDAALASPGRPLSAAERAFFEPRLGHDYSRVRVHTGALATASADAVNARAYTVGNQVVLGTTRRTRGPWRTNWPMSRSTRAGSGFCCGGRRKRSVGRST